MRVTLKIDAIYIYVLMCAIITKKEAIHLKEDMGRMQWVGGYMEGVEGSKGKGESIIIKI